MTQQGHKFTSHREEFVQLLDSIEPNWKNLDASNIEIRFDANFGDRFEVHFFSGIKEVGCSECHEVTQYTCFVKKYLFSEGLKSVILKILTPKCDPSDISGISIVTTNDDPVVRMKVDMFLTLEQLDDLKNELVNHGIIGEPAKL